MDPVIFLMIITSLTIFGGAFFLYITMGTKEPADKKGI